MENEDDTLLSLVMFLIFFHAVLVSLLYHLPTTQLDSERYVQIGHGVFRQYMKESALQQSQPHEGKRTDQETD